jgi:hypothetical protein
MSPATSEGAECVRPRVPEPEQAAAEGRVRALCLSPRARLKRPNADNRRRPSRRRSSRALPRDTPAGSKRLRRGNPDAARAPSHSVKRGCRPCSCTSFRRTCPRCFRAPWAMRRPPARSPWAVRSPPTNHRTPRPRTVQSSEPTKLRRADRSSSTPPSRRLEHRARRDPWVDSCGDSSGTTEALPLRPPPPPPPGVRLRAERGPQASARDCVPDATARLRSPCAEG